MKDVIHMSDKDNLVTALRDLKKGEVINIDGKSVTVTSNVPQFHKIATEEIPKGGLAYKYGEIIGRVLEDIHAGDYVHVHNLESTRGRGDQQ